jgi:hypothetical protein
MEGSVKLPAVPPPAVPVLVATGAVGGLSTTPPFAVPFGFVVEVGVSEGLSIWTQFG